MEKKICIVTHSGTFHADELLAVAALELYLNGQPYEVIRTRDMEIINSGDYIVDVGGTYDPETNRFDHHQHGGAGQRENGIPYSAFGLVWKHFGEAIAGSKEVARAIDEQIGHPIDMGDNGVDYYGLIRQDTEPLIIQYMVAMYRPTWKGGATHDERFMELIPVMRRMLELAINVERDVLEGGVHVEAAYQAAEDKRIIILDNAYPWGGVLSRHPEPLYVVKPKSVGTHWEVECVRDNPFGFANRKDLPESWAGILEIENKLPEVTGVPDAIFCHNRRYIAVAKSKEGALKLAQLALNA
jgi:uncharacterized UPF0160 family protein